MLSAVVETIPAVMAQYILHMGSVQTKLRIIAKSMLLKTTLEEATMILVVDVKVLVSQNFKGLEEHSILKIQRLMRR